MSSIEIQGMASNGGVRDANIFNTNLAGIAARSSALSADQVRDEGIDAAALAARASTQYDDLWRDKVDGGTLNFTQIAWTVPNIGGGVMQIDNGGAGFTIEAGAMGRLRAAFFCPDVPIGVYLEARLTQTVAAVTTEIDNVRVWSGGDLTYDSPGCFFLEAYLPPATYDSAQLELQLSGAGTCVLKHATITLTEFRNMGT